MQRQMNRFFRGLGWPLVAVLLTSLTAAYAFSRFASEMVERELDPVDKFGLGLVDHLRSPFADTVFMMITRGGTLPVLLPLVLAGAWVVWRRTRLRFATPLVLAPILAWLTAQVLKGNFARVRPLGGLVVETGHAFPSGHTTSATAVALTIGYVFLRERIGPTLAVVLASAGYAFAVGLSRVYLNVHWTSDVIGGWMVGCALAAACATLYERARKPIAALPGLPS